jgi:hypothetical protein
LRPYRKEQLEAVQTAIEGYRRFSDKERGILREDCREYLAFRSDLDHFLKAHFSALCTRKCYRSRRSACCSKDGIIVFFADVVIDLLASPAPHREHLRNALLQDRNESFKCVYLGPEGCRWHVRPIVCAMFLCDAAQKAVLEPNPALRKAWDALERRRKSFTWPDRSVLFDRIERMYRISGHRSSLMHCHESPGLLRIKQRAGLTTDRSG